MIMFLSFMLMISGFLMTAIFGLLPGEYYFIIPNYFRYILIFFGGTLFIAGRLMIDIRARRTGADFLMAPGRPGHVLWIFIHKDGEIRLIPSLRAGEGQLHSKELDSQIVDVKSYMWADHRVRIVPEVVGHAVDMDYILYVNLLKTRYGIENLKELRESSFDKFLNRFGIKRFRDLTSEEKIAIGRDGIEKFVERHIRSGGIPDVAP